MIRATAPWRYAREATDRPGHTILRRLQATRHAPTSGLPGVIHQCVAVCRGPRDRDRTIGLRRRVRDVDDRELHDPMIDEPTLRRIGPPAYRLRGLQGSQPARNLIETTKAPRPLAPRGLAPRGLPPRGLPPRGLTPGTLAWTRALVRIAQGPDRHHDGSTTAIATIAMAALSAALSTQKFRAPARQRQVFPNGHHILVQCPAHLIDRDIVAVSSHPRRPFCLNSRFGLDFPQWVPCSVT